MHRRVILVDEGDGDPNLLLSTEGLQEVLDVLAVPCWLVLFIEGVADNETFAVFAADSVFNFATEISHVTLHAGLC